MRLVSLVGLLNRLNVSFLGVNIFRARPGVVATDSLPCLAESGHAIAQDPSANVLAHACIEKVFSADPKFLQSWQMHCVDLHETKRSIATRQARTNRMGPTARLHPANCFQKGRLQPVTGTSLFPTFTPA